MSHKYTLYSWTADDEGGVGVCTYGSFHPGINYYPETGWRAAPSEKIGDFSTVEELTDILLADSPECYECRADAEREARWLMANCLPGEVECIK